MPTATHLVSGPEGLAPWSAAWDALPLSRGDQADLFDSFAWLGAWLAADPSAAHRLRTVVVLEGETLAAALPLVADGPRRWSSAGIGFRPRFRPALLGAAPREETIDALADALAHAEVRDLALTALPARDPATAMLEVALQRAGFAVGARKGSSECFSPAAPSFEEHARQFKKYARTVSNFSNKAARLGAIELEAPGGRPEAVLRAFETYRALHARGWKGALREPMASFRRELLARTAALGWARPFAMTVAGVPVASMLWFRLGAVAIAYSTVYDERMAALSPGTIAMWRAHEAIFDEGPTAILDYLPGHGSQKDQLGTERPPLVTLEASRRGPVGTAVSRAARRVRGAAARWTKPRTETDTGAPGAEPRVREGSPGKAPGCPLTPLELSAYAEIFLAVAGGFASPQKMRDGWAEGDLWFRVGEPPRALARVGEGDGGAKEVREVVALVDDARLSPALDALADLAAAPIRVPVRIAPFPWTGKEAG